MLAGGTSPLGQLPLARPLVTLSAGVGGWGVGAERRTLSAQIPPHCGQGNFLSLRPTDKGSVFSLLTVSFSEKRLCPAKNLCDQLGQPLAVLGCSKLGGNSGTHTAKPWLMSCHPVCGFVHSSWACCGFQRTVNRVCASLPYSPPRHRPPGSSPCVPQLLPASHGSPFTQAAGPSSSKKASRCLRYIWKFSQVVEHFNTEFQGPRVPFCLPSGAEWRRRLVHFSYRISNLKAELLNPGDKARVGKVLM